MKDQKLRKKILEIENSYIPELTHKTSQTTSSQFIKIKDKLNRILSEKYEGPWLQADDQDEEYMNNMLTGDYDKAVHKAAHRDIIKEEFKYIFYGKIYEMAKNDLDDPELEELISFNEETGFFELTDTNQTIEFMINGLLIPSIVLVALGEGKVDELDIKISKYRNRHGLYPKELFIEAFNIQKKNKGKIPKITNKQSIVLANDNLKTYPKEKLINRDRQGTELLHYITKTYVNYHKRTLKERPGEY